MKNFMLLPAPSANANKEDDNNDEDFEATQETFSDCEQGKLFQCFSLFD